MVRRTGNGRCRGSRQNLPQKRSPCSIVDVVPMHNAGEIEHFVYLVCHVLRITSNGSHPQIVAALEYYRRRISPDLKIIVAAAIESTLYCTRGAHSSKYMVSAVSVTLLLSSQFKLLLCGKCSYKPSRLCITSQINGSQMRGSRQELQESLSSSPGAVSLVLYLSYYFIDSCNGGHWYYH